MTDRHAIFICFAIAASAAFIALAILYAINRSFPM